MTAEVWTIVGTGIALAALIIGSTRTTWREIDKLDQGIDSVERKHESLKDGLAELRERIARIEGLLEAMFMRRDPTPDPRPPPAGPSGKPEAA